MSSVRYNGYTLLAIAIGSLVLVGGTILLHFSSVLPVTEFIRGGWPSFVAASLAIIFGVPAGLLADRHILNLQRRRRKAEKKRRLQVALNTLQEVIEEHQSFYHRNIGSNESSDDLHVAFDIFTDGLSLNVTVWGAVQDDIVGTLERPTLQKRLDRYFSRAEIFVSINKWLIKSIVSVESALGNADRNRLLLLSEYKNILEYLIDESESLTSDLKELTSEQEAR